MTPSEVRQKTLEHFNRLVAKLSPEQYEEALCELIEDLEIRREAVLQEMDEDFGYGDGECSG